MPTSFATIADVESAWRALTDAEATVATTKLGYGSRILRRKIKDIDTRIAAYDATSGTGLDPDLVKDILVEATIRHLRNPDGWRQEAIEDFSRTRDTALSSGMLSFTRAELALLGGGGGAFTVPQSTDRLYSALGGAQSVWCP